MASMTFLINDSSTESTNPNVWITITENADGTLTFLVTQETGDEAVIGDLRGLFFDVADESLIGTLSVLDTSIATTDVRQGNDTIKDLGQGANMNGLLGSDGGYDVGIEIGTSGIGKDDVRSYSFTLDSSLRNLTLADFSQVSFGVRLTSVGIEDGTRSDSSKIGEETFRVITAVSDAVEIDENDPAVMGNVFANDPALLPGETREIIGIDGEALNAPIVLTNAEGATLTLYANGDYILDASGADNLSAGEVLNYTFTYNILQRSGTDSVTSSSTLTITVNGVNDAPVAVADAFAIDEAALLTGNLLINDTDVDRLDTKQIVDIYGPENTASTIVDGKFILTLANGAVLRVNANGTFEFDQMGKYNHLRVNQTETVNFTYLLKDNNGAESLAPVEITIQGVDSPPVAVNDHFVVNEDSLLQASILANDFDPDHDSIRIGTLDNLPDGSDVRTLNNTSGDIRVTLENGAVLTVQPNGTFVFNQNGAYNTLKLGEQANLSFSYTAVAADGLISEPAMATITINGVNDAPVAVADTFMVNEDTLLNASSVLNNDFDPDLDEMRVVDFNLVNLGQQIDKEVSAENGEIKITLTNGASVVMDPSTGTFTFDQSGAYNYLGVGESENLTFSYTVEDVHGAHDTSSFTITINGVNDAPVASPDAFRVIEQAILFNVNKSILLNDMDPDSGIGDKHVISLDILPEGATQQLFDDGIMVTLENGAALRMHTDGTFEFYQNGAYDYLQFGSMTVPSKITETFGYTMADDQGAQSTSSFTIEVFALIELAPNVYDFPTNNESLQVWGLQEYLDSDDQDNLTLVSYNLQGYIDSQNTSTSETQTPFTLIDSFLYLV